MQSKALISCDALHLIHFDYSFWLILIKLREKNLPLAAENTDKIKAWFSPGRRILEIFC